MLYFVIAGNETSKRFSAYMDAVKWAKAHVNSSRKASIYRFDGVNDPLAQQWECIRTITWLDD